MCTCFTGSANERRMRKNDDNEEIKSADSETPLCTFILSSDRDIWYPMALMVLISVPKTTDIGESKITYLHSVRLILKCIYILDCLLHQWFQFVFSLLFLFEKRIKFQQCNSFSLNRNVQSGRNSDIPILYYYFSILHSISIGFNFFSRSLGYEERRKNELPQPNSHNKRNRTKSLQQIIQFKFRKWEKKNQKWKKHWMNEPRWNHRNNYIWIADSIESNCFNEH